MTGSGWSRTYNRSAKSRRARYTGSLDDIF